MTRREKERELRLRGGLRDVRGLRDLDLAAYLDDLAHRPALRWMPYVEEAARRLGLSPRREAV